MVQFKAYTHTYAFWRLKIISTSTEITLNVHINSGILSCSSINSIEFYSQHKIHDKHCLSDKLFFSIGSHIFFFCTYFAWTTSHSILLTYTVSHSPITLRVVVGSRKCNHCCFDDHFSCCAHAAVYRIRTPHIFLPTYQNNCDYRLYTFRF